MYRILTLIAFLLASAASAHAETRTYCFTDHGTKTCHTISVKSRTVKIQGISAKKYEQGVRAGKCMPSPAGPGVCGGG
jgi:hypothetical protein